MVSAFLRNHVVLMFIYAAGTGLFFALLQKRETGERIRLFLIIFSALFFGGILLGWAMYPFPLR